MDVEELRSVVERVRLVPDRHRVLDRDAATASRVYRIGAPLLSDLLDLGLPHRSSGGERYFDELDLENVALGLRLPSPRYLAMRRWPDIFRTAADGPAVRYELQVSTGCGWTEPDHPCDLRVAPEVDVLGADLDATARQLTLHREVRDMGRAADAPDALRELFAEVSGLYFHILPLALYRDLAFVTETSLANCELASLYVAERASEAGWETRRSFGLLLSSPYSALHFWPEVRLDGIWTAFDPHLVHNLVRWKMLAPDEVSPAHVMSSAYLRIGEDWLDLVEDAGRAAPLSFLTRRRSLDAVDATASVFEVPR